ncbi:hypothetical protein SEA_KUWABARA_45 [Gordonia phage Kuwabara]|nr:hypothetical protein SEA_KUWABARA_45 [Gordonia phage Kuwabara]
MARWERTVTRPRAGFYHPRMDWEIVSTETTEDVCRMCGKLVWVSHEVCRSPQKVRTIRRCPCGRQNQDITGQ